MKARFRSASSRLSRLEARETQAESKVQALAAAVNLRLQIPKNQPNLLLSEHRCCSTSSSSFRKRSSLPWCRATSRQLSHRFSAPNPSLEVGPGLILSLSRRPNSGAGKQPTPKLRSAWGDAIRVKLTRAGGSQPGSESEEE